MGALSTKQQLQLSTVLRTLETDGHAPTAVRNEEQAAQVHVADSLAALEIGALRAASKIADIGSGAGFPGLALAVALPNAGVSLIESNVRKCEFLERASRAAEVKNASVICARVEHWRDGLGRNDVVVARALAAQPVVLEYAAPLLRLGGTLVDWRGQRNTAEEGDAACAAEQLGLRLTEILHTEPYQGARHHHLHVYEKAAQTPPRFPRRVGAARKRPLGC